jgi:NAD(P)-dependent dehydrogenase (short-subunit alcohol dehydrogenase family)
VNLKNIASIVTGGASGLGAATAQLLASAGSRVAILDVNERLAKQTATAIGAVAFNCDVTDEDSVKNVLHVIREQNGVVRILINCAGVGGSSRIVGKNGPMPLASFEKVIKTNLVGSFNMIRLVAEQMIASEPTAENERGVIVSTVSVAAYEGQIGQAAYAASKGGIASLTLPAAREFAQFGIRVNAIAPGLFETPLMDELSEEAKKSLSSSIPFPKRLGMASEFAKLAVHIVENIYINGEVIRLDGALRMQSK